MRAFNRVLLALAFPIVSLFDAVAAAPARSNASSYSAESARARLLGGDRDDDALLFAITGNYEPYEYVTGAGERDVLTGDALPADVPTGFAVETIKRACDACDLSCEFVLADAADCWTSGGFPGLGLQAGHFDACAAYTATSRRQLGVAFGDAVSRPRAAGILTRLAPSTREPVVRPTDDLSDVVVAVVGGYATTARSIGASRNTCANETFNGSPVDGLIALVADDPHGGPDAAMRALLDGDADALYAYASLIEDRKGCKQLGCDASLYDGLGTKYAWIHVDMLEYQVNGTTLAMTKKGSPLIDAFNPCVRSVMRSTWYADACARYAAAGFDDVECYPNAHFEAAEEGDDLDDDLGDDADAPSPSPAPAPASGGGGVGKCASGRCPCDA